MANPNVQMFGCDINEFMESVDDSGTDYFMAAMSVLSDAQELLNGNEHGKELARQYMNRAKYLISELRVNAGRNGADELSKRTDA